MHTTTPVPIHPLHGETLLSFAAAARQLPSRSGGRAHPSSIWRWTQVGARTPGGGRVRLERVKIGSVWFTSREALARFLAALAGTDDNAIPVAPASPTQIRLRNKREIEQLERIGI